MLAPWTNPMMVKSRIVGAIIALTAVCSVGVSVVHAATDDASSSVDPSLSGSLSWEAKTSNDDVLPMPLVRVRLNPNEPIVTSVLSLRSTTEIQSVILQAYQRSPLTQSVMTSLSQTPLAMDRAKQEQQRELEKQKKGETQIVTKKEKKKVAAVHYAIATEPASPPAESSDPASRVMYVSATAYSSTPDQTDGDPCTTANGYNVCKGNQENVLAANFLPFGTKVRLPDMYGNKVFVVQDRMARRFSNRIDVWMKTRDAAMQFGIRKVKIEVLED